MSTKKTGKKSSKRADAKPPKESFTRVYTSLSTDDQLPRMRTLAKKRGLHTDAAILSNCLNEVLEREGL